MHKKGLYVGLFFVALLLAGFSLSRFKSTPKPARTYTIGILVRGSGYDRAVAGYKATMETLGYREGKEVMYTIRLVSNQEDIFTAAKGLVDAQVDLIHTYSTPATKAAYEATKHMERPIPVVFGSVGDPLATGTVKGIQSSGTNVTGVASLATELTAKRLDLIKKVLPNVKKVAMPRSAEYLGDTAASLSVEIAQEEAKRLGLTLLPLPVEHSNDNERVAGSINHGAYDAIIVGGDSLIWGGLDYYIAQARKEKLPLAVFSLGQVERGALVGFGPDYAVSGRQAAIQTDKIFKGKKPTDIPIEVPQKLLLIVNTATARVIGLALDPAFIASADVVIDK